MRPGKNIEVIKMNFVDPIRSYKGKLLSMSGWGSTEKPNSGLPEKLQVVDLKVVKTDASWEGKSVSPERILQSSLAGGKGPCFGDSGGTRKLMFCSKTINIFVLSISISNFNVLSFNYFVIKRSSNFL